MNELLFTGAFGFQGYIIRSVVNSFSRSLLEESRCFLSHQTGSFIAFFGLTLLNTCNFADYFDRRLGVL